MLRKQQKSLNIRTYTSIHMLSPFMKKLLIARQLFLVDGKVELLGVKHTLLPVNVVTSISDSINYKSVKESAKIDFQSYIQKIGSSHNLQIYHHLCS